MHYLYQSFFLAVGKQLSSDLCLAPCFSTILASSEGLSMSLESEVPLVMRLQHAGKEARRVHLPLAFKAGKLLP